MTITLDLPAEMEGQLQLAARLRGKDISTFLLDSVRHQLRSDVLPESESALLEIINAPIAPEARSKRDTLLAIQSQRELTEEERNQLSNLIDEVELANANRWQCIADLA